MMLLTPDLAEGLGITVLILSLVSIVSGGGFIVGLVLGIVGGILGLVWKPTSPAMPTHTPL